MADRFCLQNWQTAGTVFGPNFGRRPNRSEFNVVLFDQWISFRLYGLYHQKTPPQVGYPASISVPVSHVYIIGRHRNEQTNKFIIIMLFLSKKLNHLLNNYHSLKFTFISLKIVLHHIKFVHLAIHLLILLFFRHFFIKTYEKNE